jgi:hypothetical protein
MEFDLQRHQSTLAAERHLINHKQQLVLLNGIDEVR